MSINFNSNYYTGNKDEGYTDYTNVQKFMSGIVDDIEATYGSVNGLKVLDVGCAFGYLTNELALRGADVVGLDSSTYAISQAEILFPSLTFVNEDVSNQSERNNFYDLIVGMGIFDCLFTDVERDDAFIELDRVSKNNADIYLLTEEQNDWYSVRDQTTWLQSMGNAFGGLWIVQSVKDQPFLYDWRIIKAG